VVIADVDQIRLVAGNAEVVERGDRLEAGELVVEVADITPAAVAIDTPDLLLEAFDRGPLEGDLVRDFEGWYWGLQAGLLLLVLRISLRWIAVQGVLEVPDAGAESASQLGDPLASEDQEENHENQYQLGNTD
jgi:hypothetical protein